jgi:hypothetical protein
MAHRFASAIFLAVFGITTPTALAQTPTPPAKADTAQPTVLSGCLLDSRADTTTADSKGVIYTLDVAETSGADAPTIAPTKPEAPAAGSAARSAAVAKTRYALSTEGAQKVDLSKHVGHHVELTGRLLTTAQAGVSAKTTPGKPLPGAAHRMFQVSALKMVSAKCP